MLVSFLVSFFFASPTAGVQAPSGFSLTWRRDTGG